MPQLLGEYECKLDAKGRMRMPAQLIKQLSEGEEHLFVVNRGFEKHLMLYPKNVWDRISAEINQLSVYNRKNLAFIRYFYRGAQELTMDSADRILIPKSLLEYGDMDKEVVIFAYNDRMEIWSKAAYEQILAEEPEDFLDLAEEVMGKVRMGEQHTDSD